MRGAANSIQGLRPFVLGVLGYATWSALGGTISDLSTMGCIRTVTRVSTGIYTVTFFPEQQFYVVAVMAPDYGTGNAISYLTTAALTNSKSCQIEIARSSSGIQVDRDGNQVTILGPIPVI